MDHSRCCRLEMRGFGVGRSIAVAHEKRTGRCAAVVGRCRARNEALDCRAMTEATVDSGSSTDTASPPPVRLYWWKEAALVLGFYDDVVVRVTANGRRGALVDVRSASRFGQHDLGANATRVRKVMTALVERIQATVPKKVSRRKLRRRRNIRRRSNGG